jgi:hypothetical protein
MGRFTEPGADPLGSRPVPGGRKSWPIPEAWSGRASFRTVYLKKSPPHSSSPREEFSRIDIQWIYMYSGGDEKLYNYRGVA